MTYTGEITLKRGQDPTQCACDHDRRDCPIHVECDQKCRALLSPVTVADYMAAHAHWRWHEYTGGCSHGI